MKTFKTRTIYFVPLPGFSSHVIITSITALGMFTNLYLALLLPLTGWLVPKFPFQLTKKARVKSGIWSGIIKIGRWRESFAHLRVLYSDRARSFYQ